MPMGEKEQREVFGEVFNRLRETERVSAELCVKLDNVIAQMQTNTMVTDRFIELLEKRRTADEAREAKLWKAIAVLGGALVILALGKDPARMLMERLIPSANATPSVTTDIIAMHSDHYGYHYA